MLPITSSTARVVVGAAVLAAAAIGTVATPGTAHGADATSAVVATPPATTVISIRALTSRVAPGADATIRGNLQVSGPVARGGRPVVLEARPSGEQGFTPVASVTSTETGLLRTTVQPEVSTRYRWSYAGSTDAGPRVSGTVPVRVGESTGTPRRAGTTLSVRFRPSPGRTTDVVRGRLVAGRAVQPRRAVVLLTRSPGQQTWSFAGSRRTDARGVARFTVAPATSASYQLRYLGSRTSRPAASGVVQVAPRPAVSAAASASTVLEGTGAAITGSVALAGTPQAGAVVDLLARPRGDEKFHLAATTQSDAAGAVSVAVLPERTTRYRLSVRATPTTAAVTSSTVRVRVVG